MARKTKTPDNVGVSDLGTSPDWPTTVRTRMRDGRIIGADNSVWLYMKVPLSPVEDAKTISRQLDASAPLLGAFDELAGLTRLRGVNRRRVAKGSYREYHLALVNLRNNFRPPPGHDLGGLLRSEFHNRPVIDRVLLIGVRLVDTIGGTGGLRGAIDSVMESLSTGGVPLADFDKDTDAVRGALTRAGMVPASEQEMRLVGSWWNHGDFPDTPIIPEGNCLNVFRSAEAARVGKAQAEEGKSASEWPAIGGYHSISFGAVQNLDFQWAQVTNYSAQWATQLIDNGAVMISVRGLVEPGKITSKEIEAQRKKYVADIEERYSAGQLDKQEQKDRLNLLEEIQSIYATASPPPTMMDTSIVVAFDGIVDSIPDLGSSSMELNAMTLRQMKALGETWFASHVRSNPHRLDLPASAVAYSGLVALSRVGDEPAGSALLGFTERDRQPVWLNPTAAMDRDTAPCTLVAGATGSGKSVLSLNLADQFARLARPVVMVQPKQGEDASDAVLASGGHVVSLDNILSADGVLDPLRFSLDPESGIELAASVLAAVNPWGRNLEDYETPLAVALKYGVDRGARCTGDALMIAYKDGRAPEDMVRKVTELASANALFRAIVGMDSNAETALRVAEGITLIKVGNAHLPLPEPGTQNPTLAQRTAMALVRMLVMGSATAVAYRDGIVFLDEAWVFLSASTTEIERLGRLARSQRVSLFMMTQRVSDALRADVTDFISTGIILPLNKESEAIAACKLLDLEPTPERLVRILADATQGTAGGSTAPNWNSLRALHQPGTRQVIRGTVGIFADLHDRAVTTEITIPPSFLRLASTNKTDVEARRATADAA